MADFEKIASIVVSVISGLSALVGGWSLIPFISYYQEYIAIKYDQEINPAVIQRGYITAMMAIVSGLFFFYRVYFIIMHNYDFQSSDWLMYDLMTGIFMFMSSHFMLSLYRERRRIEKLVADRNDNLLSETF